MQIIPSVRKEDRTICYDNHDALLFLEMSHLLIGHNKFR